MFEECLKGDYFNMSNTHAEMCVTSNRFLIFELAEIYQFISLYHLLPCIYFDFCRIWNTAAANYINLPNKFSFASCMKEHFIETENNE